MRKFLAILEETGYFKAEVLNGQLVKLAVLPLGNKLMQNIEQEWIKSFLHNNIFVSRLHSTVATEVPAFKTYINQEEFKQTYDFAHNQLQFTAPFNILDQFTVNNSFFTVKKLVCTHLFSKTVSQEIFQRIQRERKLWWMKHFSNPTTQSLSEISGTESIQILTIEQNSNFIPKLPLETVELCTDVPQSPALGAIRFSTTLEETAIGFLEDAMDLNQFVSLDIHRKLAPIQMCIFYNIDNLDDNKSDLLHLGRLLELRIRNSGISCLNSDRFCIKSGTKDIYNKADQLGITYGIQLDDESLRSGLIKLRNRKTKLFETIHTSDIPNYLIKIFQSVN